MTHGLLTQSPYGVEEQLLNIQFLENEPSEICSHLSEKLSKGRFFAPDKIENHTSEGKGQEKKK